uniref:Uncharacterized protein n=1 Tax=Molossus molossus TaxID=27622 RepID=A0A7J8HGY7_MOLMO|nr:hypothetical protein HJG59_010983 [Molossus molossus]
MGIHTPLGLPPQQAKMHCHGWTDPLEGLCSCTRKERRVLKAHHPLLNKSPSENNSRPSRKNSFPGMKEDIPVTFPIQSWLLQLEVGDENELGGWPGSTGDSSPRDGKLGLINQKQETPGNSKQLLEAVHVRHLSSSLAAGARAKLPHPTPPHPMMWGQGRLGLWPSSHE